MESGVHPEMWTTEPPSSWLEAPHYISVTTLTEIETCPRQWAVKRADYPTLWERRGYPQRVHEGALRGSVVHMALEVGSSPVVVGGKGESRIMGRAAANNLPRTLRPQGPVQSVPFSMPESVPLSMPIDTPWRRAEVHRGAGVGLRV